MNTTESTIAYLVYISTATTLRTGCCYLNYEDIKELLPHIGEEELETLNSEGLWLNEISASNRHCELIVVVNREDINWEAAFISEIFRRCTLDLLLQVLKGRNVKYGDY